VPAQEVLNYSLSMAERISKNAPLSLAAVKKAAYKGEDLPLESVWIRNCFTPKSLRKRRTRRGNACFFGKKTAVV
jgi:enoyl-CoA hydratase/carnithine racemase